MFISLGDKEMNIDLQRLAAGINPCPTEVETKNRFKAQRYVICDDDAG